MSLAPQRNRRGDALVRSIVSTCAQHHDHHPSHPPEMGVSFKKKPTDGNMRQIAFAYDPDEYWIELVERGASFKDTAANLANL